MTLDVNTYGSAMGRWAPDARERLERAALELFLEQGFSETTVPQITARAGLTTRTFFRHFADKREVLFAGEEELPALVEQFMAEAPAALGPLEILVYGMETLGATLFEGRIEHIRMRRAVIDRDESLRERELRKLALLSEAMIKGFQKRGIDKLTSTLAAEISLTVFRVGLSRWMDEGGTRKLAEVVGEVLATLRTTFAKS
jgi:AcrR family transcriptional regulator